MSKKHVFCSWLSSKVPFETTIKVFWFKKVFFEFSCRNIKTKERRWRNVKIVVVGTTKTDDDSWIGNKTQIMNYIKEKIQKINLEMIAKIPSNYVITPPISICRCRILKIAGIGTTSVYKWCCCWRKAWWISVTRCLCIRWSRLCSRVVESGNHAEITMMSRLSSPRSPADIVLWRRVAVIGCHSAFVARHSSPRTSFLALPRDPTPGNLSAIISALLSDPVLDLSLPLDSLSSDVKKVL